MESGLRYCQIFYLWNEQWVLGYVHAQFWDFPEIL